MWLLNNDDNPFVPTDYVDTRYKEKYPLGQVVKDLRLSQKSATPKIVLTDEQYKILADNGFEFTNPYIITKENKTNSMKK